MLGSQLCKSLYVPVTTDTVQARNLFSMFKIFHINDQVRSDCEIQKRCLKQFRRLPKFYPSKSTWTAKEKRQFKVINKEIIASLTREISKEDMIVDDSWELAPIITNNNPDRYRLNSIRLSQFAKNNNKVIVKWKKKLI